MTDVIYINAEEGRKRLNNNAALYVKLLDRFKSDKNFYEFEIFSSVCEWDRAQAAAHAVKGIAANLSLKELFRQSVDVEAQIKGKSLKPESLANIKICYNETLAAVDRVIAQNGQ